MTKRFDNLSSLLETRSGRYIDTYDTIDSKLRIDTRTERYREYRHAHIENAYAHAQS